MSDFGATISATKKDGGQLSNSDIADLSSKLDDIINDGEFENAIGDPMSSSFERDQGKSVAIVQLSEHYFGGDPDEDMETFEFVKETEESDIVEIKDALIAEFPEFSFKGNFGTW